MIDELIKFFSTHGDVIKTVAISLSALTALLVFRLNLNAQKRKELLIDWNKCEAWNAHIKITSALLEELSSELSCSTWGKKSDDVQRIINLPDSTLKDRMSEFFRLEKPITLTIVQHMELRRLSTGLFQELVRLRLSLRRLTLVSNDAKQAVRGERAFPIRELKKAVGKTLQIVEICEGNLLNLRDEIEILEDNIKIKLKLK